MRQRFVMNSDDLAKMMVDAWMDLPDDTSLSYVGFGDEIREIVTALIRDNMELGDFCDLRCPLDYNAEYQLMIDDDGVSVEPLFVNGQYLCSETTELWYNSACNREAIRKITRDPVGNDSMIIFSADADLLNGIEGLQSRDDHTPTIDDATTPDPAEDCKEAKDSGDIAEMPSFSYIFYIDGKYCYVSFYSESNAIVDKVMSLWANAHLD